MKSTRTNIISLLFGNGDSAVTCRFITAMRDSSSQAGPRTENIPAHSCFSVIVLYATRRPAMSGYDDILHQCYRSPAHLSALFIVQKIDLCVTIFEKR